MGNASFQAVFLEIQRKMQLLINFATMRKPEKFKAILAYFETHQPNAETELNYSNPFDLLVAVILSAQCTDKRVNLVTPALMSAFPTPASMAASNPEVIFEYIKSVSYPNNKSKHLVRMAQQLMEKFGGQVPSAVSDLVQLAGVGRKTANVIASVIFNQPTMAVDTHVFRVSARLGLTTNAKNPLQAEQQLLNHIPKNQVAVAHHWLILHGRYTCIARKPLCEQCPFTNLCKYYINQTKKTSH